MYLGIISSFPLPSRVIYSYSEEETDKHDNESTLEK